MQVDATDVGGDSPGDRTGRWAAAALILAVAVVYANSFRGVMLLDDRYIERTPSLGDPALWAELKKSSRPIVDLSLAVNERIGGMEPVGYHVWNLLVHLAATLALFGVVRRSLAAPGVMREKIPVEGGCEKGVPPQQPVFRQQTWLAFLVALLWAVHPLQTQSVTYISQRAESMMGLFYWLTLYGVARAAGGGRAMAGSAVAVVSCALGMLSKQVMVTAPVVAILYDRAFWATSWSETLRKRWKLHAGLAVTWGLLLLVGSVGDVVVKKGTDVGFGVASVTPIQYGLTQFDVIRHYLRLAIWPDALCLDYQWPIAHSFAEVAGPAVFVILLVGLTIVAWARRPAEGFVGVWFFGVLLPTSSFVPIKDVIFEHRMYLSLASVVVVFVLGGQWLLQRLLSEPAKARQAGAIVATAVALLMGVRTYFRNRDYGSAERMWASVVERYPHHSRALTNLGAAYLELGRFDESEKYCRRAVEEAPTLFVAQYNLGHVLMLSGRGDEAIEPLQRSSNDVEVFPQAMLDLGAIQASKGRTDAAIACFREAVRAQPGNADAHFNLGCALRTRGDRAGALAEFREVLRLRPQDEEARRAVAD